MKQMPSIRRIHIRTALRQELALQKSALVQIQGGSHLNYADEAVLQVEVEIASLRRMLASLGETAE